MEVKLFLGFKTIVILSIAIKSSVCLTAKEEIQRIISLTPSDPGYNSRCAKIDCSRDAFWICVQLKFRESSKKYILNIRKCEMDKLQCFGNNMSTSEIPMKYCYPYKNKSTPTSGEHEAQKEKRARLAFVPKRVKREIIKKDNVTSLGSNKTEINEMPDLKNSTVFSLDNSTALRSIFKHPMFENSMFGDSDDPYVQGKKKKTTKTPKKRGKIQITDSAEKTERPDHYTILSSAETSSEDGSTTTNEAATTVSSEDATDGSETPQGGDGTESPDPFTILSSSEASSDDGAGNTQKPPTVISSEDEETPCEGKNTTPKPTTKKKCDQDQTVEPQKLTTKKLRGNANANIQIFSKGHKTVYTPDNATIYHNQDDIRRTGSEDAEIKASGAKNQEPNKNNSDPANGTIKVESE